VIKKDDKKDDKKKEDPDRHGRSLDRDTSVTESADSIESPSEVTLRSGKILCNLISTSNVV